MKKWKTGMIAAAMLASLGIAGYANAYGGYGHGQGYGYGPMNGCPFYQEMSEQERADFNEFEQKRNALFSDYLKGEVKAGRLTQAEADAMTTLQDSRFKRMHNGNFQNKEAFEEARKARLEYHKKLNKLRIESVQKAIQNGTISEDRGKKIIERLENWDDEYDRDDYPGHRRGHRGGGYGRGW